MYSDRTRYQTAWLLARDGVFSALDPSLPSTPLLPPSFTPPALVAEVTFTTKPYKSIRLRLDSQGNI